MKQSQPIFQSILAGTLLFASWPVSPLTCIVFFAWTPLLLVAEQVKYKHIFFRYALLTCLVWNTGATWWLWNASGVGAFTAVVANSLFMSIPWWGYHIYRQRYGKMTGYLSLVSFWMLFEYLNLNWQLGWPWLTLGNVFASHPGWVQWYEYTGVGGGSLLTLLANLGIYEIYTGYRAKQHMRRNALFAACTALITASLFLFSWLLYKAPAGTKGTDNVIVLQPNIDPYRKFDKTAARQDMVNMAQLSEKNIDTATRLLLWPETAMSVKDWQANIRANPYYKPVFDMVARHPGITLLSGVETAKAYGRNKTTATANKTADGSYYDDFNSAATLHAGDTLQFYNKNKLVPGVESMPSFLYFMAPMFEKFGGTTGGYGRDMAPAVFRIAGSDYIAAPIVCYESIYGEYVTGYVKKGATILTIITNDGWWGNTAGYKQHFAYARLRAIETRRWVARSANTGVSAVIDERGNIIKQQGWGQEAVIRYNIPALTGETFYVRFGDYIFRLCGIVAVILMVLHLARSLQKKLKKNR